MSMDESEHTQRLVQSLTRSAIVNHINFIAVAILVYDYILTIHRESTLVWSPPGWHVTKVVFAFTRYSPFPVAFLAIYNDELARMSPEGCMRNHRALSWLIASGISVAEAILALRTWAVWGRNLRLGIALSVMIGGSVIPHVYYLNEFLKTLKFAPSPFPGHRGCFPSSAGRILFVNWTIFSIIEAVVFCLMFTSAWRAFRAGNTPKMINMIYVDGVVFYAFFLCLSVTNVIFILLLPEEFIIILSPLEHVLHSLVTSRILFNIRALSRRSVHVHGGNELYMTYEDTAQSGTWMSFALPSRNAFDSDGEI